MLRKLILSLCLLTLTLPVSPAMAQDKEPKWERCTTSIHGEEIELSFISNDPQIRENRSLRERWRGAHDGIDCPSFISLRYLTPELTDDERGPFCLVYDEKAETFTGFSEGKRNAYAQCKEPTLSFCERVNDTKDTALIMSGLREPDSETEAQLTKHGSGATIVKGKGGFVTDWLTGKAKDAMKTGATAALASVTAPAAVTAAAVTLVGVGGAVYVCRERD